MDISEITLPHADKPASVRPLGLMDLLLGGWVLLALAIALLSLYGHMQIGLNNDHLVLMDDVRKLLAGAAPYVDYVDVSPPLIHFLFVPPYLLYKATGLPLSLLLYLFTDAAILLSLYTSHVMLRRSGVAAAHNRLIVSTLAVALLAVSFIHQPFADRDHLMLVLITPWLVLYSPLADRAAIPARWRVLAACMAAVGFAIKPFFYVFYLATLVFHLWHRPAKEILMEQEHRYVIGFGACYLAVMLLYFPSYLFTVLPVGLDTYGAISWDWNSKFSVIRDELLGKYALLALVETLALLIVAPDALNRTTCYLYLLLIAAALSYASNFGWYYTQYPFMGVALLLTLHLTCRLLELCGQSRYRNGARLAIALTAGFSVYHYYGKPALERAQTDIMVQRKQGHPFATPDPPTAVAQRLESHLATHPRFIFLTLDMWSVDLLQEGTPRENVGRFDILWPLPGLLRMQPDPTRQARYRELFTWLSEGLASDIERHKPDMILSDMSPQKRDLPPNFNIADFLMQNPHFARAMGDYALTDKIRTCQERVTQYCAYDIYFRK